jgi:methylornithine synthase
MAYVPPRENIDELKGLSPQKARDLELLMIAILRITHPMALIPASLDVEGIMGLPPRLNAGANLITSFVPSGKGLSGVAQMDLDIENEGRSVSSVVPILESLSLSLATRENYLAKVRNLS